MIPHGVLYAIVCAVPSLWLAVALWRIVVSPLKNVPGPSLARLTNLWYLFELKKGKFAYANIELHKRYGMS
jgi:hypothetical protein